jgi:hypothetical protein
VDKEKGDLKEFLFFIGKRWCGKKGKDRERDYSVWGMYKERVRKMQWGRQ